jgi:hypothetical protein
MMNFIYLQLYGNAITVFFFQIEFNFLNNILPKTFCCKLDIVIRTLRIEKGITRNEKLNIIKKT